ncbi:MAG: hypothetical protein K6T73_09345, partial [Candidatus Bathyarchaeota archaeon]|nr:hypothetical protein [Candidatus Bathyarchaeota archaeon]
NIFNYVFCITLLQNTPNQFKTLNEIKRVAKKDATIVVSGLKKVFTRQTFKRLLKKADLQIVAFKSENLKCHIAVCTNLDH